MPSGTLERNMSDEDRQCMACLDRQIEILKYADNRKGNCACELYTNLGNNPPITRIILHLEKKGRLRVGRIYLCYYLSLPT
jgi:hypothetical protein